MLKLNWEIVAKQDTLRGCGAHTLQPSRSTFEGSAEPKKLSSSTRVWWWEWWSLQQWDHEAVSDERAAHKDQREGIWLAEWREDPGGGRVYFRRERKFGGSSEKRCGDCVCAIRNPTNSFISLQPRQCSRTRSNMLWGQRATQQSMKRSMRLWDHKEHQCLRLRVLPAQQLCHPSHPAPRCHHHLVCHPWPHHVHLCHLPWLPLPWMELLCVHNREVTSHSWLPLKTTQSLLWFALVLLSFFNVLFLSFKKTIMGLKDRAGEESLCLGLTSEQIKALVHKVKKCEQVLKMGTNQVEIAEQLDHDIVKEHVHRLRDQLFHLDRLHPSARLCEWSTTE